MLQQMTTTSFNAKGVDVSFRRSCPSAGEWRRAARLPVVKIVEDNGGNRLGGDSVRIWRMQSRKGRQRVCCQAHRLLMLPVTQLEWRWVEKEAKRTPRTMSCAQMLTSVTNARCCDRDRAACDFRMRSACKVDRREDRRDGHPVNMLMGCMHCCEAIAVEIACAASS